MAVDKIILELQADVKGFKAELANVRKDLDTTQKKTSETAKAATESFNQVSNSLRNVGAAIGVAFGVQQVVQFGKASVNSYLEAEKNAKLLLFALNGNAEAQQRLIEQSQRIQKTTIYSDDQVQQAQTFLANQGMTEAQIIKTIEAATQLATVTGTDLQTATEQLSATYEGQVGRLGKLDSGFKTLTKEQLANGAAVDLVISKYNGLAEATGETTEGKLIRFQNQLGDLQEELGAKLIPVLTKVIDSFSKLIENIDSKDIELFIDIIKTLAVALTTYKVATAAANVSTTNLTKSFNTLKLAFATNPFGLIATSITTLLTLIPGVIEYFDSTAESAAKLDTNLESANKQLEDQVSRAELINATWDKFKTNKGALSINDLKIAIAALNDQIESLPTEGVRTFYQLAESETKHYTETQEQANKRQEEYVNGLKNQKLELEKLLKQSKQNTDQDKKQVGAFELLNNQLSAAKKLMMDNITSGKDYYDQQRKIIQLTEQLEKIQLEYNAAIEGTVKLQGVLTEPTKELIDLLPKQEEAWNKNTDAIKNYVRANQQLAEAEDPTIKRINNIIKTSEGVAQVAGSISELFTAIGDAAAASGQKNAEFQKALALFAIQLKLAESIANIIANITKESATPFAIAANIISGVAAVTTAIGQSIAIVNQSQVPAYADGTAFVGLNGNPRGVDTIPAWLNEGEAVIPTDKNNKYPGLASAWIKGNLDDYIMSNWVAPAVEQARNKDLAQNIAEALKVNSIFDDYRLYRSLEKNSNINQSGFHTLSKAMSRNNKKRGGYA